MRTAATLILLATLIGCASNPSRTETSPAQSSTTPVRLDGFLPLLWNEQKGQLLLEIPKLGQEMIYQVSLAAGIGSNPIGLDRGQLGDTYLIRFERAGAKVLMVQPNQRFRALGGPAGEQKAVEDSFAASILWSFKIESQIASKSGGAIIVDATDFFLRDAHGVAKRLKENGQGSYSVDANRSAIYEPRTKVFPRNTEVEATITLVTSDRPGPLISSVTPTPDAVTVRQHHSFVELPSPGYRTRKLDPRAGFFGIELYDYASDFAGPLEKRFISRHRLQKKDPAAAVSDPVEPIIYYVDHGVPEPIRGALVEGASWWKEAFEKAGFHNAFDVRILPADVDPMDIRYNVITWVHRSTRGWSYGSTVTDPRTGEIIKGTVSLGSLRIRQDVLLASGLIAPYEGPNPEVLATLDASTSPTEMALARIRQLSAHEVGHTLGIDHNFAASTYDRASVMDYPAPLIRIREGKLDLSDAYGKGVGAFDIFAVRYGYSEFRAGTDEEKALSSIIRQGVRDGMLFVSDDHARDPGSAHPLGAVWDNGSDPIAMLAHEMAVRRIALDQFGIRNLRPGEPLSQLESILLPLYLHHRYQLEAALKSLGGAAFSYAVRETDGEIVPDLIREVVPAQRQREALRLALQTIEPSFLSIPQRIIDLIPPPAFGYETGIAERFERSTSPLFDPLAAARASASITLNALLHPARAARLERFHVEDAANPSAGEVAGALVERLSFADRSESDASIRRAVRGVAVAELMKVASELSTDGTVRSAYEDALRDLARRLRSSPGSGVEAADRRSTVETIERFLARPLAPREPVIPPPIPPGPPIGG